MNIQKRFSDRRVEAVSATGKAVEFFRWLYVPALAFIVFSYPLTTVFLLEYDIDTARANFLLKGVIAALFSVSFVASLFSRPRIPSDFYPLFLFFTFYGARLVDDVVNKGILAFGYTPQYVLLYFFGLTVLPALAIAMGFRRTDIKSLHNWLFWVLALANIALIYYVLTNGLALEDTFAGRFEVEGDLQGTAILNPIFVSLIGCTLSLYAIGLLAAFKTISLPRQAFYLALFGIGIANLLAGGSRGPVVAFGLGMLFVIFSIVVSGFGGGHLKIRPRIFVYLAGTMAALVALALERSISIGVFDRFRMMFEGGRQVEERDYIYAAAWQDFLNSPVIGKSYMVMNNTTFPHNAFLEALAAVGVFGGIAYIFSMWIFLRGVFVALLGYASSYAYSIGLAAVAFIAFSMTSGSIGQSPDAWAMIYLMMCLSSIGFGGGKARCQADDTAPAAGAGHQRSTVT